ncbi:MAG: helix-turn-helix domain-containing protein, partial [Planctomycetaceae bacterium]
MRTFQVLEAFSLAIPPCSLNDLAKMTGLHKSYPAHLSNV